MNTFTMPKSIGHVLALQGTDFDGYIIRTTKTRYPEDYTSIYTAEALRDVLEQAAKWLDFYDGEGLRRAEAIRSMKEQIK